MRGKVVNLKAIADEALQRAGTVEHVVVVRRTREPVAMEVGRDYFYDDLMNLPISRGPANGRCPTR